MKQLSVLLLLMGDRDSLSWRVTEPIKGTHEVCNPFFAVRDADYPAAQVWVVGYVHNHPCGTTPSSDDLGNPAVERCEGGLGHPGHLRSQRDHQPKPRAPM